MTITSENHDADRATVQTGRDDSKTANRLRDLRTISLRCATQMADTPPMSPDDLYGDDGLPG